MSAPTTPVEFLDLVTRSCLLERGQLDRYQERMNCATGIEDSVRRLAQAMIDDGALTNLQAGMLLRGKWKNFTIGGKYKLLEHIGTRSTGSVYLCEHLLMRRRVALKVIQAEITDDGVDFHQLDRAAQAAGLLEHRNIVRVYDVDRAGGALFLVLEYVDGANLQRIIERGGPLATARAVNCIIQASDALSHAHDAGMLHGDLTPANLMLDRFGTIKVLNLGLAGLLRGNAWPTATTLQDVHALGSTLSFLLTGRKPAPGDCTAPISTHRPDLPRRLAAIIDGLLMPDPKARRRTAAELRHELAAWDEGQVVPPESEMPKLCAAAAGPPSACRISAVTRQIESLAKPPRVLSRPKFNFGRWVKPSRVLGAAVAAALSAAAAVLAAQ